MRSSPYALRQKWRLIFRDKMNIQTNQEAGVIPTFCEIDFIRGLVYNM